MDVRDTREWEEISGIVFNEFGYLMDESGICLRYIRDIAGPGGDWDIHKIEIEGLDSGESVGLYGELDNGSGRPNFDVWEFTQELAYFIADSQGGEVEEEGRTCIVRF